MTIHELKEEVEALGFSCISAGDDSLTCTVNRALRMIQTYHPKEKRVELGFFPEETILRRELMVGEGTEVSLSVPAGRLTMKLQGEGHYTVRYGAKSLTHGFSCISKNITLIFPEDGELIFSADSFFCAWDIIGFKKGAFPYDDATSPHGDYYNVDLKRIFSDLIYLTDTPKNMRDEEIKGVIMPDLSHILIPRGYRGMIKLIYRARANELTEDSKDDDAIDLSDELCPLLPLLVSYFLMLDDDEDIAKTYLREYEKLSQDIKRIKDMGKCSYRDVNRWS